MNIDDAIRAAGNQLQEIWKNPRTQAPENDLNPNPAALAFRCKILEDKVSLLETKLGEVIRLLNNGR